MANLLRLPTGSTQSQVVNSAVDIYLKTLNGQRPAIPDVVAGAMMAIRDAVNLFNVIREKSERIRYPKDLNPSTIAQLMLYCYDIVLVPSAGVNAPPENDLLGIYQTDGAKEGTYDVGEATLRKTAKQFRADLTRREWEEVEQALRDLAERRFICEDRDLIAVNNGIFNYKTKTLMPFDPKYVFLSKSQVDYKPNPGSPIIHNDADNTDWDVESWMNELSDDPEIVQLLWEILGAIIRPLVHWDKAAWFYSNTGNNGKGTLCELMRNLCGAGTFVSISLADFSKDFLLEPLLGASAIIVDENDVGGFVDRAANIKAVITGDTILVNRKHRVPILLKFRGFMVQCLNEYPRVRDKSGSFYRRQLFVPFEKCFTGQERKYIKGDYLKRSEVLEYVLHKVLHMDYYELSEPEACKVALEDYKEANDPLRQFCEEILPQCAWGLLPFSFLYDLYKSWLARNVPSGMALSQRTFIQELLNLLPQYPDWTCPDKTKPVRPKHLMDATEVLIANYDLHDWYNPYYTGMSLDMKCKPMLKESYRGLVRTTAQIADDDGNGAPEDDPATT